MATICVILHSQLNPLSSHKQPMTKLMKALYYESMIWSGLLKSLHWQVVSVSQKGEGKHLASYTEQCHAHDVISILFPPKSSSIGLGGIPDCHMTSQVWSKTSLPHQVKVCTTIRNVELSKCFVSTSLETHHIWSYLYY